MHRADPLNSGNFSGGRLLDRQLPFPCEQSCTPRNLREVLGHTAWTRLPKAVRVRFADTAHTVDYVGEFDIVRASLLGTIIAWACQLIGTPVVPRTGSNVPAIVHVGPSQRGTEWVREYQWPGHSRSVVR